MKATRLLLMMLLLFLGAAGLRAQTKVAYCKRVFSPYYELRLKYDNQYDSQDEDMFLLPVTGGKLNYAPRDGYGSEFIIDSSFADYRPTSTSHWFDGMGDIYSYAGAEFWIDNLENLNTSEVTDMSYMFYHTIYYNGKTLDLSHFDTSNVTDMSYMFAGFTKIEDREFDPEGEYNIFYRKGTLDISGFTIKSSTNTDYMFKDANIGCLKVPTSANYLAATACEGVGTPDNPCILVFPSGSTPSGTTQYDGYFTWKGGYFKYPNTMEAYYTVKSTVDEGDGETWVETKFYYDSQRDSRVRYDASGNANPTSYLVPKNGGKLQIPSPGISSNSIVIHFDSSFAVYCPTNTSSWFADLKTGMLIFSGMEYLNTSEVTDMSHMFQGAQGLGRTLDLSHFDTSKVTDMSYMLAGINSSFVGGEIEESYRIVLDLSTFTIGSNTVTTKMMENTLLTEITVPATANYLALDAFSGVGTASSPRVLHYPDGFAPVGATQYNGYFTWRGGYFNGVAPQPEAYAYLSSDEETLTFYYDGNKQSRSTQGTVYGLPENRPDWYEKRSSVKNVVFDTNFAFARPTRCWQWFYGMVNLTSITNIENLKTDEVTSTFAMFQDCRNLNNIDVSGFNTGKVTDMGSMFRSCTSLQSIDLSGFNTEKVTDMEYMFQDCISLESLDLSNFTFKSTTKTKSFLEYCSGLISLTIPGSANYLNDNACNRVGTESSPCVLIYPEGFDLQTSSDDGWYLWKSGYFKEKPEAYVVLDGSTLTFYFDEYRENYTTSFDLNTENNDPGWISNNTSVTTVVFDESFANTLPTSCYKWFYGMSNLTTITDIENLKTDEVTNMQSMFYNCSYLKSLDVSGFNTTKVTDMSYMFYGCSYLKSLDVSRFNTANTVSMVRMFQFCISLESLDLSGFTFKDESGLSNSNSITRDLVSFCGRLKTLIIPATANYLHAYALAEVGSEYHPCVLIYPEGFELTPSSIDEGWYIWKGGYFQDKPEAYVVLEGSTLTFNCDGKRRCHTTSFDLNTGRNDPGWISNNTSVETVVFDASFANTLPTSCYKWFYGMSNLTSITDIENLKTDEVTIMQHMFYECSSLESLDVSGFNTAKVTDMTHMFDGCSSLESLDVSGLITPKSKSYMFYNCSSLKSLDLSGFTFSTESANLSYTANLLTNCTGLKMLIIPATANNIRKGSFTGVGTKEAPCVLIYPDDFTLNDATTYNGYFQWKGGYFKENLKGDTNIDGNVTMVDVMLTANKVLNKPLTDFYDINADFNGDNKITVTDVMSIINIVLNIGH